MFEFEVAPSALVTSVTKLLDAGSSDEALKAATDAKSPEGLRLAAKVYRSMGDTAAALKAATDAVGMKSEGATLNELAKCKGADGMQSAEGALAAFKSAGSRAGEAVAMCTMSAISLLKDEPQKALDSATDAAAVFRDVGEKTGELMALEALANAQSALTKYSDAVKTTKQMVEMAKEMGDLDAEGSAQMLTADVFVTSKAYDEAIEVGQAAVLRFKQFGSRAKAAQGLHVVAKACLAEGYYEDAKELAEQALILFRQVKAKAKQAYASITMSGALAGSGDISKAAYRAEQASEIFKGLGMSAAAGEANTAGAAAYASKFKADDKAGGKSIVQLANAALKLYAKAGDSTSKGYALAVQMLGFGYFASGTYTDAVDKSKEAQAIFQTLNDPAGEAKCLTTLAQVNFAKGESIDAVSTARQAVSLFEEAGDDKAAKEATALIEKFQASPEDLAKPQEEETKAAPTDDDEIYPMVALRNLVPGIEKCTIYTQYDAFEGRSATTAARPRAKSEREEEKAHVSTAPKEQAVFAVKWVKAQPLGGDSKETDEKEVSDKKVMMAMNASAPGKAAPVYQKKTEMPKSWDKSWDALFG